jgi:hypothetical protein
MILVRTNHPYLRVGCHKNVADVEGPSPGGVVLGLIFLFISLFCKLISQGQRTQEHNGVKHGLVFCEHP